MRGSFIQIWINLNYFTLVDNLFYEGAETLKTKQNIQNGLIKISGTNFGVFCTDINCQVICHVKCVLYVENGDRPGVWNAVAAVRGWNSKRLGCSCLWRGDNNKKLENIFVVVKDILWIILFVCSGIQNDRENRTGDSRSSVWGGWQTEWWKEKRWGRGWGVGVPCYMASPHDSKYRYQQKRIGRLYPTDLLVLFTSVNRNRSLTMISYTVGKDSIRIQNLSFDKCIKSMQIKSKRIYTWRKMHAWVHTHINSAA